jgi:DNA-binding transcriptional LysR family regulator
MLTLYKLEIFATVIQAGSFSQAAERMFLSQSAISQHIAELEAQLGTKLFERGPRGVRLTASGKTLQVYTQQILALVNEAQAAVTDVSKLVDGQIKIGATPGINIYLLPGWTRTFYQRYPNLSVNVQTDVTPNVVESVLAQRLNLGIVEGEIDAITYNTLGQHILETIDLYVIIGKGHRCWYRETAPADALDGQAFVARQHGSQTRTWFESILAQHNIKPRIIAEFDNQESIKHAVATGMGITILPQYAVAREVEMGILRAIPIDNVSLKRQLKLIWNKQQPFDAITRAFLKTLTEQFTSIKEVLRQASV